MQVHEEVIRLSNVTFHFPDRRDPVLENVSFAVRAGERLVISGASGCGKSTLLLLLNRLYPFNCDGTIQGDIWLFGKKTEDFVPGEINQRIATVFQDPDTQFCMPTVEEELAFTLENLNVPSADIETRIASVLELTSLSDFRYTKIHSLSGGLKQRVAVACALVMNPKILLLDEPLSHLDPLTSKKFVHWLDALQKRVNLTIIAVEHRLASWNRFFTREICLGNSGKVLADRPFIDAKPLVFPARLSSIRQDEALHVSNLAVTIAGENRLLPMSFSMNSGEVTIIAGPNGSGKTTLLKALVGILNTSGSVKPCLQLGYVPQSPEYMFLTSTIKQELAFSQNAPSEELTTLMDRLDLLRIAESNPFSVSHGQKRRVAIGAMLADKRNVLLMDEPTAGQDAASLRELYELIRQRAADGDAFLIVTHDMSFAYAVADSVLLLKNGSLSGKFDSSDIWNKQDLLFSHQLLPPEGDVKDELVVT